MTQVYDLSDPAKPVHIRDFGHVGQEPGATSMPDALRPARGRSRSARRPTASISATAPRDGLLQIVDREKLIKGPKEPTPENLLYPQVSRLELGPWNGAHTALPVLGFELPQFAHDARGKKRDFVFIVNESLRNECTEEARQLVYVVDVTNEKNPLPVANFDVPEASGNFCSRGGRFGAHSSNEYQHPAYERRILFFAWFNAGVRAVDVRDPYRPKEIGYFIPATTSETDQRCVKTTEGMRCKTAIQSNNLEVDSRGYIYVVDRADTGVHILELTGSARAVANFK